MICYRTIDLPFVMHLESDYKALSPNQMLLKVLERMKMPKEDIMSVMGLSAGAFRTSLSRINSKILPLEERMYDIFDSIEEDV